MLYAIAAVLVLILDQWLKYWVTVNVALSTGTAPLIPGIVSLVNIHNYGAAFGILDGGGWRWVFVAIAALCVLIVVYALRMNLIRGQLGRWAAVGVLAGAIGNCIDRVMNGYVVDMFKLEFMNYAIFNIADMFISCCGFLFILYIIFGKTGEAQPRKAAPAPREPSAAESRRAAQSVARANAANARQPEPKAQSRHSAPAESRRAAPAQTRKAAPARRTAELFPQEETPVRPVQPAVQPIIQPPVQPVVQPPVQPAVQPAVQPVAQPAPKAPAAPSESFSLDDILAEFK